MNSEAREVAQCRMDARPVDPLVLVEDGIAHPGGLHHQLRQGGGESASSGSFAWTVPASDAVNGTPSDTSNAAFSITSGSPST